MAALRASQALAELQLQLAGKQGEEELSMLRAQQSQITLCSRAETELNELSNHIKAALQKEQLTPQVIK